MSIQYRIKYVHGMKFFVGFLDVSYCFHLKRGLGELADARWPLVACIGYRAECNALTAPPVHLESFTDLS